MSALTSLAVGLVAGVLVGLAIPAFRPHDPITQERVDLAADLLSDCTRRMVAYAGEVRDCREEAAAARKAGDVIDALAGAAR